MKLLASLVITVIACPIGTTGLGMGGGATDGKVKRTPGTAPPAPICALAVSPDERFALTGSARGELRRYALRDTLTWDGVGKVPGAVTAIVWQGDTAFVASDAGHLFVLPKGGDLRELARAPSGVRALAVQSELLLSGGDDGRIRLWSVQTGDEVGQLLGHKGPVTGLALADGTLWSTGWDRMLREWKLHPPKGKTRPPSCGRQRFKLVVGPREACAVAVVGEHVLTTGWDGAVRLWEAGKKRQKPVVLGKRLHQEWTAAIACSKTRAVALAPATTRAVALAPAESGYLLVELGPVTTARFVALPQVPSAIGFAQGKLVVGRCNGSVGWVALPTPAPAKEGTK